METPRNPERLAKAAIRWTYIFIATELLFGVANLYHLGILRSLPPETPVTFSEVPAELANADMIVGLTAIIDLLALCVSGFLILKWIHRTNAIAQGFAHGLAITPGWNVGWFFIPIGNLFKPFQGVRESWQASHSPSAWEGEPVPVQMRCWWACWLGWSTAGNVSFRLSLQGTTAADSLLVDRLALLSSTIAVPMGLLLIWVIRRLTDTQLARLQDDPESYF